MAEIISFKLVDGQIEVVTREKGGGSSFGHGEMWSYHPSLPDKIQKDIYKAVDGEVKLCTVVKGRYIPIEVIPERFKFPGEKPL